MSSSTAVRTRPAYRPYVATVVDVQRLSPHFVRVAFTGPDFDVFGTAGLDQRIKLILPLADGTLSDIGQHDEELIDAGEWYTAWREIPSERRSPLRTYTVRRIDADARRLHVDFVVHHDAGPGRLRGHAVAVDHELQHLDVLVLQKVLAGEEAGHHLLASVGAAVRRHRAGVLDVDHVGGQHTAQVVLVGARGTHDGEVGVDGGG